ncbi:MAG: hypothetical protein KDA41_14825, partial [Planctomycetales bacterium]|nr:hypothetical protein [Planctomycetales bacterium]
MRYSTLIPVGLIIVAVSVVAIVKAQDWNAWSGYAKPVAATSVENAATQDTTAGGTVANSAATTSEPGRFDEPTAQPLPGAALTQPQLPPRAFASPQVAGSAAADSVPSSSDVALTDASGVASNRGESIFGQPSSRRVRSLRDAAPEPQPQPEPQPEIQSEPQPVATPVAPPAATQPPALRTGPRTIETPLPFTSPQPQPLSP